jgi:hypothetical protein
VITACLGIIKKNISILIGGLALPIVSWGIYLLFIYLEKASGGTFY